MTNNPESVMKQATYLFTCLLSCFLFACSSNVETFDSTQSLGTQLDDLHKAYDANAITENEYNKAKEILIKRYQ